MEISITRYDGIRISKNVPDGADFEFVAKTLCAMLEASGYSKESIAKYIKTIF